MKKNNHSLRLFNAWNSTSSVRSRPYEYTLSKLDLEDDYPEHWFPISLTPLVTQPSVRCLPRESRLTIHIGYLLHFLDYTTDLEITYVNRAVSCITHDSLANIFNADEHLTALKLYTDEGYHALFSKELSTQISKHFHLPRKRSLRLKHLDRLTLGYSGKRLELTLFTIAFISETIIVRELSWLSKGDLIPPVLNIFQDHLIDEAKHSSFFAHAFIKLWPQLPRNERDFFVMNLIRIVHIFFRPDALFIHSITSKHPNAAREALCIMRKSWKSRIIDTTTLTIRAIRQTDILDTPQYEEALKLGGLIA